jgi:hypothetical protein
VFGDVNRQEFVELFCGTTLILWFVNPFIGEHKSVQTGVLNVATGEYGVPPLIVLHTTQPGSV